MSDPGPPALWRRVVRGAGREGDPLFWRWATLGAAVLFFLEFQLMHAVRDMLGEFERFPVAVAVTAGSAVVPSLVLLPVLRLRWAHALVVAGSATSAVWFAALALVAVVWQDG